MSSPPSKRYEQHRFLSIAELLLPWLTPQELSTISCTCHTLSRLSKRITAVRSSDASRSFEPLPIPFINTVDSHPYTYFLYTPTCLISSPDFARQFWGSPLNPNPIPQINFDSFAEVSGTVGCDCGEICDEECSCLVLRGGVVVTECGMSCDCELSCGNRETQKGVTVELKIVRVENKGWGLFAAQFIPSGLFVCEYAEVQELCCPGFAFLLPEIYRQVKNLALAMGMSGLGPKGCIVFVVALVVSAFCPQKTPDMTTTIATVLNMHAFHIPEKGNIMVNIFHS
ncbi:hypothetical protein SOVF_114880 [Spinacia oleracea]|nr:hypothetical protein SOVF_114880 [Spinacia oleracea]